MYKISRPTRRQCIVLHAPRYPALRRTPLGAGEPRKSRKNPADRLEPGGRLGELAAAAVDRAGADVFPALAVVRGAATGTEHNRAAVDDLAADLADRRAAVLFGRAGGIAHDRDPLAHPPPDPHLEAVVDDEGLVDRLDQ